MALITQDVFNRRPLEFGGAFAADSARINLSFATCCVDDVDGDLVDAVNGVCPNGSSEIDDTGMLIQNLSIQYQQPITRLYSVGSQLTYYVAGRPQGNATLARVLGPGSVATALYQCLGDVCNAADNDMCFCLEANCLTNVAQDFGSMNICIKNVVLQSLGFSIQAENMIINEQMSLFFTALLAQDGAGCQFTGSQGVQCGCL